MSTDLVFVKLGGSLITDKTQAETPRHDVIGRLAQEVRRALQVRPDLRLLIGHGSGSFGHWHASQYRTREGVHGRDAWVGFVQVAASAARLNHLVAQAFIEAGVPVLAVRPSSSARCRSGVLVHLDIAPIYRALEQTLVPLVHGDVAFDEERGGTIVSTEELMVFLTRELRPVRILLLGETPGVLNARAGADEWVGTTIPRITPQNIAAIASSLGGVRGMDVTGGMVSKVRQMLELVQANPSVTVHVFCGLEAGLLTRVLLDPELPVGTRITA